MWGDPHPREPDELTLLLGPTGVVSLSTTTQIFCDSVLLKVSICIDQKSITIV